MSGLAAGEIIKPRGAFQNSLYWLLPVIQPLMSLVLAALAAYTIAFAGVAALHFHPYIAPLLVSALPKIAHEGYGFKAWRSLDFSRCTRLATCLPLPVPHKHIHALHFCAVLEQIARCLPARLTVS